MIRQHYIWKVIVLNNEILSSNRATCTKISCVSCCEKSAEWIFAGKSVWLQQEPPFWKIMTTWWNEIGSRLLHQHSGQSSEFVTAQGRCHSQAISVFPPAEWKYEVASGCERRFDTFSDAQLFHEMRVRCPFNGVYDFKGGDSNVTKPLCLDMIRPIRLVKQNKS